MTLSEAKALLDPIRESGSSHYLFCSWVNYKGEQWGVIVGKDGHIKELVMNNHRNTAAVKAELYEVVRKAIPYYMGPQYYEHNPR